MAATFNRGSVRFHPAAHQEESTDVQILAKEINNVQTTTIYRRDKSGPADTGMVPAGTGG